MSATFPSWPNRCLFSSLANASTARFRLNYKSGIRFDSEKNEEITDALDTGGGRISVTMGDIGAWSGSRHIQMGNPALQQELRPETAGLETSAQTTNPVLPRKDDLMKSTTHFSCFAVTLIMAALPTASFSVTPARASLSDSETKLNPSDAAAFDNFGFSVAISGNTTLVGARWDDDGGFNAGSAYLFDVTTGNQIAKLTASDAAAGDSFGKSVAISGITALVGAVGDDDGGRSSGSAYLFDVTTGNQIAKLTASDTAVEDWFGYSVAISGNTAMVGAIFDRDGGSLSGSAYLFDVTTGNQIAKLTASDATAGDRFGSSVAISGNTALVGALQDDDGGSNSGSAYLFDVTTGNQIAKLTASDAASNDNFGSSVAISGNTALVGAFKDDDAGSRSGSAYLFDITTGDQIAKLTASDAAAFDRFGFSVAISGNTAMVGAYADDDGGNVSGSAYLFDVTTGNQFAKLTASDAAANDNFGWSVAISDNTALVGAFGDNGEGFDSGSAYLFENIPEPSGFLLATLAGLFALVTTPLRRRREEDRRGRGSVVYTQVGLKGQKHMSSGQRASAGCPSWPTALTKILSASYRVR